MMTIVHLYVLRNLPYVIQEIVQRACLSPVTWPVSVCYVMQYVFVIVGGANKN